jgi:hypothetical protein
MGPRHSSFARVRYEDALGVDPRYDYRSRVGSRLHHSEAALLIGLTPEEMRTSSSTAGSPQPVERSAADATSSPPSEGVAASSRLISR